jgi:antitoxin (DNA-binding transcriptional repressor) of toxin-antitoxin stability system
VADRDESRVAVSNDELVTVRDAMRGLNRMVAQLQSGERDQFVLMQRGRMVARIVPIEEVQDALG